MQAKLRKIENELKRIEEEIESLETRDSEIDAEMSDPAVATNVAECVRLSKEKEEIGERINLLMERWESLQESESES